MLLYQTLLVRAPLKLMLLGCALAGTALSSTQLLLVTRANVRLGISDKVGGPQGCQTRRGCDPLVCS